MELAEEKANKRTLDSEQSEAKKKLSLKEKLVNASNATELAEKIKKIKKMRQAIRAINIASALSLIGVIVTWAIMSLQIIIGNLLGVKEIALEGTEIVVWAVMSIILLAILVILIFAISAVAYPWSAAISTIEAFGDWLTGN